MKTGKNDIILNEFNKLIKQIQFDIDNSSNKAESTKHMFRLQSIKKAINAIQNINFNIKSVDQVKDIQGIGKGSLARIAEILQTGKLKEINEDAINKSYVKYIDELSDIFGIGRKTAIALFKKHNIKSIDQLKKLHSQNKIDLPDNIVKGLKYYGHIKENIPRLEIDMLANVFKDILYNIDPELFGTICGSYRRLQMSSNDIDMLLIHPSYKNKSSKIKINYIELFLIELQNKGYLVDTFTSIDVHTKFMGLIRLSDKHPIRRLDIRFIPIESYYYALFYFTGPKDFNKKVRQIAIDNNYILNEYGLYNSSGKLFPAKSENDIFKHLNLEYISPEKRK